MININHINQISTLLNGKKIIKYELISNSFNINCVKICLSNNQILIAKYYSEKNNTFNAITSEKQNLKYLEEKNIKYFPKIIFSNEDYLITEYIENNNNKPKKTNLDFEGNNLKIKINEKFLPRRGRINCSLNENGKWRWFGTQFTVVKKSR